MQAKLEEKEGIDGFLQKAGEAFALAKSMDYPVIIGHYDADGLSSTAIVAEAFKRMHKPYKIHTAKRIDEETLAVANASKDAIFVDLGAGALDSMDKLACERILILDHHQVQGFSVRATHLNPHLHGLSGDKGASASTVAYFCFRELAAQGAYDLAILGVTGAVGDMQDSHEHGMIELNKLMVEDGAARGSILVQQDLRMFGRVSRPLYSFISFCTEPFLPGLTNDEKACALFLKHNRIPLKIEEKWLHYYDLDVETRRELATALIQYAFEKNVREDLVENMVGDVFLFPREPQRSEMYDAYEFATLLNACGRHGKPALGIRVCMHDEGYEEAHSLLVQHRTMIRKGIGFARRKASDYGNYYFFDARSVIPDTVVGIVASTLVGSGLLKEQKPVVAFAEDEHGNTKVSGRASKEIVLKGINIGKAMAKASEGIGQGGGHAPAGGTTIEQGKEAEFLLKLKSVFEEQLAANERKGAQRENH